MSLNETNQFCQHRGTIYQNLNGPVRNALITVFACTGIFGFFINLLVVYLIHKTQQLEIQSIRLIRNLNSIDCVNSLINSLHLIAIGDPYHTRCEFFYTMAFLRNWIIYNSTFTVVVVAIDRFIHVKYLNDYGRVLTSFRFNILLVLYIFCVLLQSCLHSFVNVLKGPFNAAFYVMPLNYSIFTVTVVIYVWSITY